jgi:hypothetical protein
VVVRPAFGVAAAVAVLAAAAGPTAAAAPPPLSASTAHVAIGSAHGSGAFGRWRTDADGLPSYRYDVDQQTNPIARQSELDGSTDAWHQVGNDHAVANAYNHGYVQLWSQDRRYEWTNRFAPASGHLSGGFGYLRVGGRTVSTMYDDRPAGAATVRDFGVGAFRHRLAVPGATVDEHVYAPFGDAPLLLHDVTIRNTAKTTKRMSWFELWDANPYNQTTLKPIGLQAARASDGGRTLIVAQQPGDGDEQPLSIFAAAVRGPVDGHTTKVSSFFGAGGRRDPSAVRRDRLDGALAGPVAAGTTGGTLLAFRAPVTLKPGASVTLRYAYGAAHAAAIPGLLRTQRRARDPRTASARAWRRWLPQIRLGTGRAWLSRELQWDAYTLRSGASYEECHGTHVLSQGGYYQYSVGANEAYRDPLQQVLPLIYAEPSLARDVIEASAQQQPRDPAKDVAYGEGPLCARLDGLGTSSDLDLWLLWTAAEYGLATRDTDAFATPIRYADGTKADLWAHLKTAFAHQQGLLGPHGGYLSGDNGDWSDLSTAFLGMSESLLVTDQVAYVYPRLAELAAASGQSTFAAQLRAAGERALATVRGSWTSRGWFARGYDGDTRIGTGAIFGEPQPWALLAGGATAAQAKTVVANVRRYLTGVGAPKHLGGPAKIGSSQSPALNDPGITEHHTKTAGVGGNNAVYVGGAWYAVNGWLVMALGKLDGVVPHATAYAFDELQRNTLAAHATAFPKHWDGITSVDDVCNAFYSPHPEACGVGLWKTYEGQIMHQPAWSLFDTLTLAGIHPTAAGYDIRPTLPMARFTVRLPRIGVAYERGRVRGDVRVARGGTLRMTVAVAGPVRRVWAAGRAVPFTRGKGVVSFRLPARAEVAADWTVTLR